MVRDEDQDSNDLAKCLSLCASLSSARGKTQAEEEEAKAGKDEEEEEGLVVVEEPASMPGGGGGSDPIGGNASRDIANERKSKWQAAGDSMTVVVLGAFGGRFDQVRGGVHVFVSVYAYVSSIVSPLTISHPNPSLSLHRHPPRIAGGTYTHSLTAVQQMAAIHSLFRFSSFPHPHASLSSSSSSSSCFTSLAAVASTTLSPPPPPSTSNSSSPTAAAAAAARGVRLVLLGDGNLVCLLRGHGHGGAGSSANASGPGQHRLVLTPCEGPGCALLPLGPC